MSIDEKLTGPALDAALLPCPFCGEGATMQGGPDCGYLVECDRACTTTIMGEHEAHVAWNTRAAITQPSASQDAVEQVRAALPTKVETTEMIGMSPEEVAAFDSGYNAALDRAHLLLMASLAPANECPVDVTAGHLLGAGDAAQHMQGVV